MVPRPRARVWARLHRARAQHLVRRSNVTHGDRGLPRARRARPGASGPLASYRDVGRGDRPCLRDQEARSDRLTLAMLVIAQIDGRQCGGPTVPVRSSIRPVAQPGPGWRSWGDSMYAHAYFTEKATQCRRLATSITDDAAE